MKLTQLALVLSASAFAANAAAVDVEFTHFFGSCDDEWGQNLDLDATVGKGECALITTLVNKYNKENDKGIVVGRKTLPWDNYYDALKASYASGNSPDVATMHGDVLYGYQRRGLLTDITKFTKSNGIDVNDWTDAAKSVATFGDKVYAMPYDSHGLIWHVNVDAFKKAGLVDASGEPILPTSKAEWLEHAKIMKEKAGVEYFTAALNNNAHPVWVWQTLVGQQNSNFISADGTKPNFLTDEGKEALNTMKELVDAGAVDPKHNYDASQNAFLKGEVAVWINGTWSVKSYATQAESGKVGLKNYMPLSFPAIYEKETVALGSHTFILPKQKKGAKTAEAMDFLGFMSQHNKHWANTGHLPVRKSDLNSPEFADISYKDAAFNAMQVPVISNPAAVGDALLSEITAVWLNGEDPVKALEKAQNKAKRTMNK